MINFYDTTREIKKNIMLICQSPDLSYKILMISDS